MPVVTCSKCGIKNRVDPGAAANMLPKCGRCGNVLDANQATASTNGPPITLTDATFERELVAAGSKPLLIDAWAPWCGPCRMVGPVIDQLASEAQGRYRVAKLNVDENPQTAARFQISSIPTLLIFKNGKLVDRMVGAQPKTAIAARLGQVS